MSAAAAPIGASDLPALAPCIAGLRTALAETDMAVTQWLEERQAPLEQALGNAGQALARARRMAVDVAATVPAHSRRGRLVLRAVERVAEALDRVSRAAGWDWEAEPEGADVEALAGLRRALATAHRAVDAAEG